MAWWVYPAVIGGTFLFVVCLIWCVVSCVQNKFYPEGTRGPVERYDATGDFSKTKYITADGPSWKKDPKDVGPVTVYKS